MNYSAKISRATRLSISRKLQRGYNLLELLLVFAVIAAISGGGFLIYRSLNKDGETDRQIAGIVDFVSKAKTTFGLAGGNWTQFTAANLIKMNRVPSQFNKDTTKIYDAFGSEVIFGTPAAVEGTVTFSARSAEECAKMTQQLGDLVSTAAVGAAGSETVVKTNSTSVDVAAMATGCAVAGRGLKITIR